MKGMFIISTYNPDIVGSANFSEGMIDTMYYEGGGKFCIAKADASLFDDYQQAQDTIDIYELRQTQIEKVFV